jgi:acyl-CoA thioesterase-1
MSKPLLRALLAAALFFPMATAHAADPKTVIVFGDSLTQGNMLSKEDKPRLWVNQVEAASNGAMKLVNEGKGGRPTAATKEFDEMTARQPKADLLVIMLGTNDSRDVSGHCVENAVKNVDAMITKGRAVYGPHLPVLLVGPPNIYKDALGPSKPIADQRQTNLSDLNKAFEALAKRDNCDFFSTFGTIPDTSLTKDGVHPDAAGNDVLAKELLEPIQNSLVPRS